MRRPARTPPSAPRSPRASRRRGTRARARLRAARCARPSPALPSGRPAGVLSRPDPRMENRVFFPQAALDEWIVDGTVELNTGVLTILSEGRRYQLLEAVR